MSIVKIPGGGESIKDAIGFYNGRVYRGQAVTGYYHDFELVSTFFEFITYDDITGIGMIFSSGILEPCLGTGVSRVFHCGIPSCGEGSLMSFTILTFDLVAEDWEPGDIIDPYGSWTNHITHTITRD